MIVRSLYVCQVREHGGCMENVPQKKMVAGMYVITEIACSGKEHVQQG
jgi:hypothetical protein